MPDKNFENQVQQKMNELKFVPSDTVWQEVERQITDRKKHRRFLIWIPFLFIIAGGSYLYFQNNNSDNLTNRHAQVNQHTQPANALRKNIESADTSTTLAVEPSMWKINKTEPVQSTEAANFRETKVKIVKHPTAINHSSGFHFEEPGLKNFSLNHNKDQNTASFEIHKKLNKQTVNDYLIVDADETTVSNEDKKANEAAGEQTSGINKKESKESMQPTDSASIEDLKNVTAVHPPVIVKKQTDSLVTLAEVAKAPDVPAKNKKKIQWGLSINAGKANISNGLSGIFTTTADASYANAYNLPGSVNNNIGTGKPSSVKAGIAFSIGLSARKNIDMNWSVFAGLEYGYYSTKLSVGQKIDSARSVMQTGSGNYYNISSFYTSTSRAAFNYTNQFHFIQMPIGVERRLGNKSHFSLNGGLIISALIGSNALHYDGQKNIYYKNNGLLNKTNWSVFTGFNYQIRVNKSAVIETGPHLQYGLTDFFNRDLYSHMHLLNGSWSARLLFGK